ncbi:MAG: MOFRL family protein, partial [Gemmatimonadales bacterium]
LLTSAGLWEKIPEALRRVVSAVERGEAPETPKPGDPAFENMQVHLVASNRLALEAAAARAAALGLAVHLIGASLAGEARAAGEAVAERLINYRNSTGRTQGELHKHAALIWGGETTVTLGPHPGRGGRSQELALAAARVLAQAGPAAAGTALLAAGTDGRDGPTDAAGAFVESGTWAEIARQGRDPDRDLAGHDAYASLDAAGALLRTGLTGTNVMDVVIGLVE